LVSLPFLLLPAPLILLAFFSLALERKRRRAMLLDNARKFYSRITVAVPDGRLMRRVAQIGAGKIFGSLAFVTATAFALGDRFRSRSVMARDVGELGYSTHGWRLAKTAERAA
jgi:hypothetical protein